MPTGQLLYIFSMNLNTLFAILYVQYFVVIKHSLMFHGTIFPKSKALDCEINLILHIRL